MSGKLQYGVMIVGVALAYFIMAIVGKWMVIPPGDVAPLWPAAGVSLAAMMLFGWRAVFGVILGILAGYTPSIVAGNWGDSLFDQFAGVIIFASASAIQPLIAFLVLQRHELTYPLASMSNFLLFIAIAVMTCLIAPTIGSFGMYWLYNVVELDALSLMFVTWWCGDAAGVLIVVFLMEAWRQSEAAIEELTGSLAYQLVLVGISLLSFGVFFPEDAINYPLVYLTFPILLLIAYQKGVLASAVAVCLTTFIAVGLTVEGRGPFVVAEMEQTLLLLQSFVAVNVLTTLGYAILSNLQKETANRLRDENIRHTETEKALRSLKQSLERQVDERTRQLELAKNRAEQLANTDGLSDLLTRRAFYERFFYLAKLGQRQQKTSTLLMVDIDHFKQVNDLHGHLTGDNVIRVIAKIFRDRLRTTDLISRFGGEEFVIFLPDTEADAAFNLAEKLRQHVKKAQFGPAGLSVTISIGTSSFILAENTHPDSYIDQADTALYWAKSNGRDQTVSYGEELAENHA